MVYIKFDLTQDSTYRMYTVIIFLYLGSIVTQSLTKQRTDFQVALSNFIKSKHLIEELHHFGVITTYDEFLLHKGSTACAEADKDHKRCKSNDGNNNLIQGVSDNFDCKITSQNGLKQTHSMAVIMTQEHEAVEKPLRAFEFIRRKTKTELSSLPSEHFPIQRYQGPKNPSMPK